MNSNFAFIFCYSIASSSFFFFYRFTFHFFGWINQHGMYVRTPTAFYTASAFNAAHAS